MASRRGRPHPHRGHKGSHRHSTSHRKPHTGRHVPHPGARGKPHPHRGAHVPHPGARHPRHESPAQAQAARTNLAKARAAARLRHPKGQQTPAQLAAERANLAKARAARSAHRGRRMIRAEDGSLVPASYYRHHAARKRRANVAGHRRARRTHRAEDGSTVGASFYRHRRRSTAGHRTRVRHPRVRHPRVRRSTTKAVPHPHTAHAARAGGVRRGTRVHHTVVRRLAGLGGPRHHYNRHGLAKTTHWISGHRSASHPRRARWAWTVRGNRHRGWNWDRPRRSRAQW